MSREDDLERQLRSFGDTLRQQVGEPIDPISRSVLPGIDDRPGRPDRRRWPALVAAAAVVALGVGLLAVVQVGERADAPALTAPTTTPPVATIVGTSARSGGFDGPVVFGQEPVDPSTPVAEAAGGGTLRLVEGCLVAETAVGDGSATQQTLIVWGFGTTWDPATASVVLDDGHRIAVGEEFETGGGYYPLGAMNRYIGDLAAEARIRACSQLLGTAELFIQSPFPR